MVPIVTERQVGDPVEENEAMAAALAQGMVFPPAVWDRCAQCDRWYGRMTGLEGFERFDLTRAEAEALLAERVCSVCALEWNLAGHEARSQGFDVPLPVGPLGYQVPA